MITPQALRFLSLTAAGCLLAACAALPEDAADLAGPVRLTAPHSAVPAQPPGELADLALPAPPGPARESSYTEAGLFRSGAQYEPALPNGRVLAIGAAATFAPAGAATLGTAAYAIYSFAAADYDREPVVQFNWSAAPVDGTCFIGVGDYTAQHWAWFAGGGSVLELADLAPYFAPDESVYVAVVATGTEQSTLLGLRLGEVYPSAALKVTPDGRTAPLPVELDATASSTPEGELTLFEWDFDGDGSFDAVTGTTPLVEHVYDEAGSYLPQVRVTNSFGHTDTAVVAAPIEVQLGWQHGVGQGGYVLHYTSVASGPDKSIYVSGNAIAYIISFDESHLMLAKWSRDGDLLWSKRCDNTQCWSQAVAVDESGDIIMAGYCGGTGVLQKWSPAGELLWAKDYNQTQTQIRFNALCLVGDDIFVGGLFDETASEADALIARIDPDGGLVWARSYNWFETTAVDIVTRQTPAGPDSLYVLARCEKTTAPTRTFPLIAVFELDGTFVADASPSNQSGGILEPKSLLVSGNVAEPGLSDILLTCVTGSGTPSGNLVLSKLQLEVLGLGRSVEFQTYWDDAATNFPVTLVAEGAGGLVLAGTVAGSSDWGALWTAAAADGVFGPAEWFVPALGWSYLLDAMALDGRVVCCGRSYTALGAWQVLTGGGGVTGLTWGLGAGLASNETLSVSDGSTTVFDMENVLIDNGALQDGAFISYRPAPGA